jgi:hypothetical protein
MTVAQNPRTSGPYVMTEGQTVVNYTFPVDNSSELKVLRVRGSTETELLLDVDYGVTHVGEDTGQLILTTGATAGDIITIYGNLPIERVSNFAGWRAIPDNAINKELDRITKSLQEMRRDVDVSIKPKQAGQAYDFGGKRLANVGEGVDETDAITMRQMLLHDVEIGAGDVVGTIAVLDGEIVLFDGITGKKIKGAGQTFSQLLDTINQLIASSGVPTAPQGRITGSSGVPVTTSDLAGLTQLFYAPTNGIYFPHFDGVKTQMKWYGGELPLPLDANSGHAGYHQSGKNFSCFLAIDPAGGGTPRFGTGPAWPGDVTLPTGAGSAETHLIDGFQRNKYDMTLRFGANAGDTIVVPAGQALKVGGFRTVGDGLTEDSRQRRLVSNDYNAVLRPLLGPVINSGLSYDYSSTTWRIAAGNAGNKIEIFRATSGQPCEVEWEAYVVNSTATARLPLNGLGLDTTSGPSNPVIGGVVCTNVIVGYPLARLIATMNAGYHYIAAVEQGVGVDVQTWTPGNRRPAGWCIN